MRKRIDTILSKIIERIERAAGMSGLASTLAEKLAPTDLHSLLLEVFRRRSARRTPADVLAAYENDRFVRPSPADPRRLLAWEQVAFSNLPPEFEVVVLSPVCPLGANSVVAHVDQNWAVSTIRNTEVVSDSTNVLALECAARRRKLLRADPKSTVPVHLAASHRLLRAQRYTSPNSVTHFSCFALSSAGRRQGAPDSEMDALRLHIRFYLDALRAFLSPETLLVLSVTDFSPNSRHSMLETGLLQPIGREYEHLETAFDDRRMNGRGYYREVCFHIHVRTASGQLLELVDGGAVDWTRQYLSDARERLVISGIGSERLVSIG